MEPRPKIAAGDAALADECFGTSGRDFLNWCSSSYSRTSSDAASFACMSFLLDRGQPGRDDPEPACFRAADSWCCRQEP